MLCTSCQAELDPVMVVCPGCGVPLEKARETQDWRQQVKDTVERHRAKKKRDVEREDDSQLSIFPEVSPDDEKERVRRQRRAEIRARVEQKMSRARVTQPVGERGRASTATSSRLKKPGVATESRDAHPISESPVADAGDISLSDSIEVSAGKLSDSSGLSLPIAAGFPSAESSHASESQLRETLGDVETPRMPGVNDPKTMEFEPVSREREPGELALGVAEPISEPALEESDFGEPGAALEQNMDFPSPGERLLAGIIDLGLVALIQLALFYLTTRLVSQRLGELPRTALVALALVGLVMGAGYFLFFWALSGQTLGKLLTGSRVVDEEGRPLGVRRSLIRLAGALVSGLTLGLGFSGLWSDAERRGWHDRMAHSKVVRG